MTTGPAAQRAVPQRNWHYVALCDGDKRRRWS